jgi:hypothetical protein
MQSDLGGKGQRFHRPLSASEASERATAIGASDILSIAITAAIIHAIIVL